MPKLTSHEVKGFVAQLGANIPDMIEDLLEELETPHVVLPTREMHYPARSEGPMLGLRALRKQGEAQWARRKASGEPQLILTCGKRGCRICEARIKHAA